MSLVFSQSCDGETSQCNSIYIGCKKDAKNETWLHSMKISHILNVTPAKEAGIQAGVPNYFESSGKFKYKRISVYDSCTSDLLRHVDSIVTFIAKGLIHGSVLVHCQYGISRSPTCVAFYLVGRHGMTADVAIQTMKAQRPSINPLPHFRQQIKLYEIQCEQKNAQSKCRFENVAFSTHSVASLKRKTTERNEETSTISDPLKSKSISDQSQLTSEDPLSSPPKAIRPKIGPMLPQASASEWKPIIQIGPSAKPTIGPSLPETRICPAENHLEETMKDINCSSLSTLETENAATATPENHHKSNKRRIIGPSRPF